MYVCKCIYIGYNRIKIDSNGTRIGQYIQCQIKQNKIKLGSKRTN